MTQTSTKAPTKADIKAAEELEAMAAIIDPNLPSQHVSALPDLEFGQTVAKEGAARQLRERAAQLRQVPFYG